MANPVRSRDSVGTPPVHFYYSWLNGDRFKWAHDLSLTPEQRNEIREKLKSSIHRDGAVKTAENFFGRIRKCTPAQIDTLQKCLEAENYHLDPNSLDAAIFEMGEDGSLAKVRALFPHVSWQEFKDYLGVHQALSGVHMLNYADDVLTWYHQANTKGNTVSDQVLMLASLQQCSLDVSKVTGIMKKVLGKGMQEFDLTQATDHVISIIYDLTPNTSKARAQELADQFTLLHKGWGIAYPVALVTQLAREKHNKSFDMPETSTLDYSTARIDVQVARVFDNTYVCKKQEHSSVSMARLIQSLYDFNERLQFCVDGAAVFSPKEKTGPFNIEGSLFQDVGQP